MAEIDKQKWDTRYSEGAHSRHTEPNDWLLRALAMAQIQDGQGRRALDLACGRGRNALHLAALGFEVDAVDISPVGLAQAEARAGDRNLTINFLQADLDPPFAPSGVYDLIIVFHYVNMPLLKGLWRHLNPGGWLICEEHLQTELEVTGPQSSRFRVAPGALATACRNLRIHHLEEVIFLNEDNEYSAEARVLAWRP